MHKSKCISINITNRINRILSLFEGTISHEPAVRWIIALQTLIWRKKYIWKSESTRKKLKSMNKYKTTEFKTSFNYKQSHLFNVNHKKCKLSLFIIYSSSCFVSPESFLSVELLFWIMLSELSFIAFFSHTVKANCDWGCLLVNFPLFTGITPETQCSIPWTVDRKNVIQTPPNTVDYLPFWKHCIRIIQSVGPVFKPSNPTSRFTPKLFWFVTCQAKRVLIRVFWWKRANKMFPVNVRYYSLHFAGNLVQTHLCEKTSASTNLQSLQHSLFCYFPSL